MEARRRPNMRDRRPLGWAALCVSFSPPAPSTTRAADGAPAPGDPAARGEGGRLGARPLRLRVYKPLNCDDPALHARRGGTGCGGSPTRLASSWLITIEDVHSDTRHHLGIVPGWKDGVETHLQTLLADLQGLGGGRAGAARVPDRDRPGRLCSAGSAGAVAVEIKRRGEIDGVEQLTRYLELLNRDPLLSPVRGVFAAQQIKPQARTLAEDRGIGCVVLDYDALRGIDNEEFRLF